MSKHFGVEGATSPPQHLKPVKLDTFDAINNHWKCSACYMDGTTDNGGDCVCINDCSTLRPVYNDEPKKQVCSCRHT